jgi:flap endonuclease-1
MGLQIGEIVSRKDLAFKDLKGKIVAVDAYNALYQFLSSIRQQDGTPLLDSKGKVTSHLSGLFYRNIALLSEGIKLIYVFDGEYHELKGKTHELRSGAKEEAREKYEKAKDEEDIEGMGKYARGFTRLNDEMVRESIELLKAMGVGIVMAPGEGEMQCAQLVKEGKAWAVGSQDYDSLVVGGTRLIQNLTLARRRKTKSGFVYIAPELISYEDVLNELGITGDQLISLGILVGTDFNPKGVRGIGPKKALTLVKDKKFPVNIFSDLEEQGKLDFNWKDVFEIFKKPNVLKGVEVKFSKLDGEEVKRILVEEHEFSLERIEKGLGKLQVGRGEAEQQKLF